MHKRERAKGDQDSHVEDYEQEGHNTPCDNIDYCWFSSMVKFII